MIAEKKTFYLLTFPKFTMVFSWDLMIFYVFQDQNPSDVPNAFDSRKSVSAVMARLA
jgi:hypothetical protein